MARDRDGELLVERETPDDEVKEKEEENGGPSKKRHDRNTRKESRRSSDSEEKEGRKRGRSDKKRKSRRRYISVDESDSEDDELNYSDSESGSSRSRSDTESSGSEEESESEEERRRRKRKEKKRRREREEEKERKRRKRDKEKKRRRKEREEERKRKEKRRKERKEKGKKGAVTDSWGKYGIIRETDMWNKRPEFTAWLAEVKQINLESLPNWEEKQMFKQFMEDHNTATFPSKKYYNLDAYHSRKMEKEMKKGFKKAQESERTVFNDEEQRRLEMMRVREKQKEEEVEALKRSMQGGMAQAMKEQARLREEMAYQYKLGNFEAAAAIQRRLDPDVAM